MKKTKPETLAKKPVEKKKPTKQVPVGYFNPVLTLNSGNTMKLKSQAIFAEGNYVDQAAVHLVNVASRQPNGEMTVMMEVTIRAYTPKVMPEDTEFDIIAK